MMVLIRRQDGGHRDGLYKFTASNNAILSLQYLQLKKRDS